MKDVSFFLSFCYQSSHGLMDRVPDCHQENPGANPGLEIRFVSFTCFGVKSHCDKMP